MSTSNSRHYNSLKIGGLICAILLFFTITSIGQQVLVEPGKVMEGTSYFDNAFVKKHQIKEVRFSISIKDEMQPIRKTDKRLRLVYSPFGYLTRKVKTYSLNHRLDSSRVFLTYNPGGLMTHKIVYDHLGKHYYAYQYNRKGDLITEVHKREKNRGIRPKYKRFRFEYYEERQKKKFYLNDENRVYKTEIINVDENKRILDSSSRFTIGKKKENRQFKYNKSGQLIFFEHVVKVNKPVHIRHEYEYDEKGLVSKESIFRNDKLLTKKEFLYEDELLDVVLFKDEQTQRITIMEMSYAFY